jgi:Zn/Cd-binding protein ZinT
MARMTKEERKIQQLASRKAFIKRIFSMFGRQPKAGKLIKKEEAVIPYTADGLFGKGDSTLSKQYTDYVYGSYLVKHASKERIREYYRMAADPEINYALTEVADEIVQEDENKKLFMLKFDEDVKTPTREILITEFRDLIVNRLRLGDYNAVWEWVYKWLVQGIILFKINFSTKEATGVESLEELQPWLVTKFMAEKTVEKDESKQEMEKHYYIVKDNEGAEEGYKYREEEILRFDCGYAYDGEFFSMLEFAKKDWRRLNLIEDATVIYKLSRSPLRRVFKVYVGKMAPKDIEHYLYDFRQRLREDIQYDSEKGEIIGFNPITMLDDYFFPVMEGGQEICTVDTVSEKDTKWESMDEIRYFLGKVYRAMKIPVGRMNLPNEAGEYSTATTGSRMGEIMRDEVKFANFIKRLQGRFMEQFIQELFYRHLFFRGLVDKLQLKKHQVEVRFSHVNPYSELKSAEVEEWRSNSFAALNGQNPLFSFIYLSKRYLKWTDEDLRENFKWLKKEQKLLASFGGGAGVEGGGGGDLMGGAGAGEIPGAGGDETLTETPPEEAAEITGTEVAGGEAAPAAPAAPVASA